MRTGRQCRGLGWDHSRVGGEKKLRIELSQPHAGSPPHGRGKDVLILDGAGVVGITPAWAGKRLLGLLRKTAVRDHPRMGGEKCCSSLMRALWSGSPPRRRGKGCRDHLVIFVNGITPAWAGKSPAAGMQRGSGWDHPRVGGEKGGAWWIIILFLGSPPHRRGKGFLSTSSTLLSGSPPHRRGKSVPIAAVPIAAGITPAWAGKSLCRKFGGTIF